MASCSGEGVVSKRGRRSEVEEDSPAKRLKAELDRELEEDEKKMDFSSPPPTMNHLSRRDKEEKPAELFRKDLISAMKMPDTESLQPEEYFGILDPWRQEWERGVQVPVHDELMHEPSAVAVEGFEHLLGPYSFKLPHKKYLHAVKDDAYKQGIHELHDTQALAEQVCRYDLDNVDVVWLSKANEEFESMGLTPLQEWEMEKVMEEMESQCYHNMQGMIKTVEGLGIEYDENVVCEVCRSPDSEDGNEMVFCDACDICVHQACYGIQKVPEGSWLCRICALGISPMCILCPRKGGAMKSTKSGTKWTHVSCALWIPEVSIGVPDKMEPITKISQIPASRWSLICTLCRERVGACIQCCVKTCNVAFHVTCAFSHGLDMKTVLDDSAQDVQLKAYCPKHTKKKDGGNRSPRKTPPPTPRKESDMTEQEKTELRSHRLAKLAEEFYTCVKASDVSAALKMDQTVIDYVWSYWVLKRKSMFNQPLLMPKREEADILTKQREDSLIARMKMFIHLRQDLERVRNLCYMVSRREKVRRQLYRLKEEIFHKQVAYLKLDPSILKRTGTREFHAITEAHKLKSTESVYDQYTGILSSAARFDVMCAETEESRIEEPPEQDKHLQEEPDTKPVSPVQTVAKPVIKPRRPGRPPKKSIIPEPVIDVEKVDGVEPIQSRVLSPCPSMAKSPSHGSRSPHSLPQSPRPGSKSPVYGSSAPTLPEPKKASKPGPVKNLFDSVEVCEPEVPAAKRLRSRSGALSPDLASMMQTAAAPRLKSEESKRDPPSPRPHSAHKSPKPRKQPSPQPVADVTPRRLRSVTPQSPVACEIPKSPSPSVAPVPADKPEKTPKRLIVSVSPIALSPNVINSPQHVTAASEINQATPRRQLRSLTPVQPASPKLPLTSPEKSLRSRDYSVSPYPKPIILKMENTPPSLNELLSPGRKVSSQQKEAKGLLKHCSNELSPSKRERRKNNSLLDRLIGSTSLVVKPELKAKVEQRLTRNKTNGPCVHMQRKIDQFFRKSAADVDVDSPVKDTDSLSGRSSRSRISLRSGRSTPVSESSFTATQSDSEFVPSDNDSDSDLSIGQRRRLRRSSIRNHDETSRDSFSGQSGKIARLESKDL